MRWSKSLAKGGARNCIAADEDHRARERHESRFVDAMAGFFFSDHGANSLLNVLVGGAVAEQGAEIVVILAEEAGADLAVGGEANAGAVAAEGLRDGSDQANFAGRAVRKFILARGFTLCVRDLDQRPLRVDAAEDFFGGGPPVSRPLTVGVDWHRIAETP